MSVTSSLIRQLDETITKFPEPLKRNAVKTGWADDVVAEILCALYSQSVAILLEGEPEDERTFFQIYTAKTFDKLRKVIPATNAGVPIQELIHETSDLYFNDRPNLAELAQQMPEYASELEVKKVQEMNHRMAAFSLKAKIRILGKMGVSTRNMAYDLLGITIQTYFLHNIKFFERLRPVLDGLE